MVLGDDTWAGQNYRIWSVYAKPFLLMTRKTNQDLLYAQACHLVEKLNLWILFLVQSNRKRRICDVERNGWSLDTRSLTESFNPLFLTLPLSAEVFYLLSEIATRRGFLMSNDLRLRCGLIEISFHFFRLLSYLVAFGCAGYRSLRIQNSEYW